MRVRNPRLVLVTRTLLIAALPLYALIVWLGETLGVHPLFHAVSLFVLLLIAAIMGFEGEQSREILRYRARMNNWRVCPSCHYDLPEGETDGSCPECGTAYTHGELEAAWLSYPKATTYGDV